jgi:hypothetical protein
VVDASLMLQREYTSRHDTKQIGQQSSSSVWDWNGFVAIGGYFDLG